MGKLRLVGRVLDCLHVSSNSCTCFCFNTLGDDYDNDEGDDVFERKALMPAADKSQMMTRLRDVVAGNQTLAFQLKPKMVVLRVSMHCNGCARKVEKRIAKLDGVTSYKVDLESKRVVVIGDILPFEVLESVSKVKNAQLWI